MTPAPPRGEHVHLRVLRSRDRDAFLEAVRRSRRLHDPWVAPPDSAEAFDRYVRRDATRFALGVFRNTDDALVGVVNLSPIVHGAFQSAFMGYYAFTPYARKGYLREGIDLAVGYAFGPLGLHRVQANVRPENVASTQLIRSLGFRLESHSPRYLFLDGAWRDHLGFVRLHEVAPPVAGAHGVIFLHDVDETNFRDVCRIRARRDQSAWVTDVTRYLTLCRLGGEWQALAIRTAERVVGFVMWARDPADGSYWIGGFVIERTQQGKGYGRAALIALIEALRAKPGCRTIALSVHPDNAVARRLYGSVGFRETGEIEDGELVMRLAVRAARRRA